MALNILRRLRGGPPSPFAPLGGALSPLGDGPRVLCATSVGGHPVAPILDGVVAAALTLRGAQPNFLLCDAALPACELCAYVEFRSPETFAAEGPGRSLCPACVARGRTILEPLSLPLHAYTDFLAPGDAAADLRSVSSLDVDECFELEPDGLELGQQVRAAVLRFFGKADLSSEPEALVESVARRYAAGALVAARVLERAIDRLEPDVLVAHHGIYVPQGVLGEVARRAGIRVVNWGPSYRDRTFIFSHDDTYHFTFLSEPPELWRERRLDDAEERRLLDFLLARRRGEGDWAWVTPEAALRREEHEADEIVATLGLDRERPVIGLLTNVLWDAQLYYKGHAFDDMLEWLWFTIDHFAAHPEAQLLVRVHPHEVKRGNRQPVGPALRERYPVLPPNVHVVEYDSPFNTYVLMDLCRAVAIYGTKTGVELTPLGIPVIAAGDAWIRGKGLTIDVSTKDEYTTALHEAPTLERLDPATVELARRYAYHYFFRRMIPLTSFAAGASEPTLAIRRLDDLAPGRDAGLDVVCEGILTGREFVFDG